MSGRLYRSTTDRMISGVAGGLADYLTVDPALVRIIWAVLMIVTGGLFFLVYIVMWVVVPEGAGPHARWRDVTPPPGEAGSPSDPASEPASQPRAFGSSDRGSGNGRLIFGLVLIGLGAYFLLRNYLPEIAWGRFWPVLLVLAGAALLVASLRRESR